MTAAEYFVYSRGSSSVGWRGELCTSVPKKITPVDSSNDGVDQTELPFEHAGDTEVDGDRYRALATRLAYGSPEATLVVLTPKAAIEAEAAGLRRRMLLVAIVALCVAAALAYVIGRTIVRSLKELADAAGCALAAARVMAARLTSEVPEAVAGIGVSAGPAVAGNVGAADRFEYTVIGDPVNEAARLSEEAKKIDGHVVAAARAVDAASPQEAAQWKQLHEVHLRGRLEPTVLAVPR